VIRDNGNLQWTGDFVTAHPFIQEEIASRIGSSFVLTLGGDHSVSIPVLRAIGHQAEKKVALIYVDAHTDLSDQFRGSPFSNGCPLRRAMEDEKFSPERTVLVGTRCFEMEGLQFIQDKRMKVFPAYEIGERGMQTVAREIIKRFEGFSNVYLSIDIDALDPAFAPGTGIPDGGGLSTRDLMILIRTLDPLPVISADLVEVSPPLDHSDITSFAALRIIMEIFGLVKRRRSLGNRITLL
jgi:agmatinase